MMSPSKIDGIKNNIKRINGMQKYKTMYLSETITLQIYGARQLGVAIKITNVNQNRTLSLTARELKNIIVQLRSLTKPNIEHPFKFKQLFNGDFYVKLLHYPKALYAINKNGNTLTLDETSVFKLIEIDCQLNRYITDIDNSLMYDERLI